MVLEVLFQSGLHDVDIGAKVGIGLEIASQGINQLRGRPPCRHRIKPPQTVSHGSGATVSCPRILPLVKIGHAAGSRVILIWTFRFPVPIAGADHDGKFDLRIYRLRRKVGVEETLVLWLEVLTFEIGRIKKQVIIGQPPEPARTLRLQSRIVYVVGDVLGIVVKGIAGCMRGMLQGSCPAGRSIFCHITSWIAEGYPYRVGANPGHGHEVAPQAIPILGAGIPLPESQKKDDVLRDLERLLHLVEFRHEIGVLIQRKSVVLEITI